MFHTLLQLKLAYRYGVIKMTKNVLWMEDNALIDLQEFTPAILLNNRYNLDFALDSSMAENMLKDKEYDVIIVDIRLMPGNGIKWNKLYNDKGGNHISARLGLWLMYGYLKPEESPIIIEDIPSWINEKIIGILTVEKLAELSPHLKILNIEDDQYRNKKSDPNILLELIEHILSREKGNPNVS